MENEIVVGLDIGTTKICTIVGRKNEFGKIDILVNNAAVQYPQEKIEDITAAQLQKTFAVNIFAMFYLAIGTVPQLEDALYYSASAYATLGLTADFPEQWHLIGALEGIVGFVLIGWSTAFMATTMSRLSETREPKLRE